MEKAKIAALSICAIFTVLLVSTVPGTIGQDGAGKECRTCHITGQSGVSADGTIEKSACYQCHREDIEFTIPISSQVHLYHSGNNSVLPRLDYRVRHKNNTSNCSDCHSSYSGDRALDCTRCHVTGIHIENAGDCKSCHGPINDLFKHPSVKLVTHDIFGTRSCTMCHSQDKKNLEMANGAIIPVSTASGLCKQCHSGVYRDWSGGKHHAKEECTSCHNPHSPISNPR